MFGRGERPIAAEPMHQVEANNPARTPEDWPTRRGFLHGGLCASAAALAWPVFGRATRAPRAAGADAVIQIHLSGGLSHLDTFDPKPGAPREERSPFAAIPTALDGVEFSELCPGLARIADRLCVVRSVCHAEIAHERATASMLTGRPPSPTIEYPSVGAVVSHRLGSRAEVPPYVCVPHARPPDLGAGYLGTDCGPLGIGGASSPGHPGERDGYGRSRIGQRLLFSRCLVEAGARFVVVLDDGWDHHRAIEDQLRSRMPRVDRGVTALVTDLDQRGLLDRTLVLLTTEFGRSPRLNRDGGRDHWSRVFTILAAGGGLKRGTVLGQSSADGGEPLTDPVSPADLAATLFAQLGVDPATHLRSPSERRIAVVEGGRVLRELLA